MTPDPKPDPLPPLADAQRVLLEFFAPYDAKLARLRAENAELRAESARLMDKLRNAVADYTRSEGCGCCSHSDHGDHGARLGAMLGIPKYADGSGYDYSTFETKRP